MFQLGRQGRKLLSRNSETTKFSEKRFRPRYILWSKSQTNSTLVYSIQSGTGSPMTLVPKIALGTCLVEHRLLWTSFKSSDKTERTVVPSECLIPQIAWSFWNVYLIHIQQGSIELKNLAFYFQHEPLYEWYTFKKKNYSFDSLTWQTSGCLEGTPIFTFSKNGG